MMVCGCGQPIDRCRCPDADERLHAVAYDPESYVVFKWCRTCDKHYARCRCPIPDYYIIGGGREIPVSSLRTITGEPPDVDLSPFSERERR